MKNEDHWLLNFSKNVYSGNGEDGIIEKALDTPSETNNCYVEFGARDGLFLANSRNLIGKRNYKAVLIEGNESSFNDLIKNFLFLRNLLWGLYRCPQKS